MDERGLVVACRHCGQKNRLLFTKLGESLRCANCKNHIPPPSEPIEIATTQDFDRVIANAAIPVVVDYWAPWCGPCRMVAPELAKVAARQAGSVLVVKVNTDVLSDLGSRYRIQSIPTMAVFAGGNELARATGARPASDIEAFVAQARARRSA